MWAWAQLRTHRVGFINETPSCASSGVAFDFFGKLKELLGKKFIFFSIIGHHPQLERDQAFFVVPTAINHKAKSC